MHIEAISNGLGGQSMYLLLLAGEGVIPATVSITADTGWENDCLWSTGERTTAREYFERVTAPLAAELGIETHFVRAVDKNAVPLPSLRDHTVQFAEFLRETNRNCLKIPLYGSERGQLGQSCTQRFKISAINQQLRRLGAKTARTAQGIHVGEFPRRAKGEPIGKDGGGWNNYQSGKHIWTEKKFLRVTLFGQEEHVESFKKWVPEKWRTHYYPLVQLGLNREEIRARLEKANIPYLLSTECDGCPHKDAPRWGRTSPNVIQDLIQIERGFDGKFFFTNQRVPLTDALRRMEQGDAENDFGCENDVCDI